MRAPLVTIAAVLAAAPAAPAADPAEFVARCRVVAVKPGGPDPLADADLRRLDGAAVALAPEQVPAVDAVPGVRSVLAMPAVRLAAGKPETVFVGEFPSFTTWAAAGAAPRVERALSGAEFTATATPAADGVRVAVRFTDTAVDAQVPLWPVRLAGLGGPTGPATVFVQRPAVRRVGATVDAVVPPGATVGMFAGTRARPVRRDGGTALARAVLGLKTEWVDEDIYALVTVTPAGEVARGPAR